MPSSRFWLYFRCLPHPSCGQRETTAVQKIYVLEQKERKTGHKCPEGRKYFTKGYTTYHKLANKKPLAKKKAERRLFLLV